ncbi:MAG: Rrf2 family transcriptional regulator [Candidatus Omnitrophica bacterium]|nr:Rrf2 family transcriptional regulator [Candidatus Omnitrophota bacterium]
MKLLTRDTDYAIRALVCISRGASELVTVKQLTQQLKIPRPFLRKILQCMNKAGILRSYKGKGGGFSMAQSSRNIPIFDVMVIFQGEFKVMEHVFKKEACCKVKMCELKKKIDKIETNLVAELKKINISDLC